MRNKKVIEYLQKDLQVPETVKARVEETLDDIRLINFEKKEIKTQGDMKYRKRRIYKWSKKTVAAAVIAVVFLSGITVTAAVNNWGLKDAVWLGPFEESKEIRENMEKKGVVTTPLQKIEHGGVKVELLQCVTDNEYYSCLFRVTVPEKLMAKEGEFEDVFVLGNDQNDTVEELEYYRYADGTESQEGEVMFYVLRGTHLQTGKVKGGEKGKKLTFTFENYGTYDSQGEFEPLVEDVWEFQWREQVVTDKKNYQINEKIGAGYYERSNSVLETVKITPITVTLIHKVQEADVYVGGEEYENQLKVSVMLPTAIELSDGTLVDLNTYGSQKLTKNSEDSFDCKSIMTPFQIIEPEEVVALHFGTQLRLELKQAGETR